MTGTTAGFYIPNKGISVLNGITIQNTIYVSKNGDDSTALVNRLDKPFLTIYEASLVANAGDVIYVFSGIYDEQSNDWVASDVIYDFQIGTYVFNDSVCIADNGIAKNINISGHCVFSSNIVIVASNPSTRISISCKGIEATTSGIVLSNLLTPFYIKFNYLTVSVFNAISLSGTSISGSFEFDKIIGSQNTVISIINANTDLTERNIYFNGKYIEADLSSQATRSFLAMGVGSTSTKVFFRVTSMNHTNVTGGLSSFFLLRSGKILINNTNAFGYNYGLRVGSDAIAQLNNSNISCLIALNLTESGNLSVNNSILISENDTISPPIQGAVQLTDNSELILKNCQIVQRGNTSFVQPIILIGSLLKIRLISCILIGQNSNPNSISELNNDSINIYVEEDCSVNLPTGISINNIISGTNIIVSSNISENTNNFY